MISECSRVGSATCFVAFGLVILVSACHPPHIAPRTTVDVGLAGGSARSGHYDFLPREEVSHADYGLFGGTVGVRYIGRRRWGGVARLASSGGVLTYAEDIYRDYGLVFDRYHVTSFTLDAAMEGSRGDVALGLSILAGASSGDQLRSSQVVALPHANFFIRIPRGVALGLLFGSEDGFVLDATVGAIGLRYAQEAFRLGAHGGFGARVLPPLEGNPSNAPRFPSPRQSGDFPVDPLAALEVHARLGPRVELGARFQLLALRPQGMLVVTFHHDRGRAQSGG